jgi:hypothetical protein
MSDRAILRLGAAGAIVGAFVTLIANLLHPRIPRFEDPVGAFVREVNGSDTWVPLHLALVAGILLIAFGQFAFLRSMKGGPADGPARLALGSLLVSTPIALVVRALLGVVPGHVGPADGVGPDPGRAPVAEDG